MAKERTATKNVAKGRRKTIHKNLENDSLSTSFRSRVDLVSKASDNRLSAAGQNAKIVDRDTAPCQNQEVQTSRRAGVNAFEIGRNTFMFDGLLSKFAREK